MKAFGKLAAASLFVSASLISRCALQAAEPEPNMTKRGPKLSDEESARIGALSLPELVEMLKTGDTLHKYYALACLKANGGDKKNFDLLLNLARTGPGDMIVEGLVAPVKPSASRQDRLRVDKFLDFLETQVKNPSASVSKPQALRSIAQTVYLDAAILRHWRPHTPADQNAPSEPNGLAVPYANERVVRILTRYLDHPDREVSKAAILGLGNVGANDLSKANNVIAVLNAQLPGIRASRQPLKHKADMERAVNASVRRLQRVVSRSESGFEPSKAIFKAEYSDPEKYVKLKWHAGMPYDRTCEVITKDKLPILNEMLSDQKYAPYWHNIARVIGYISDDPNSVSILLDYFKRDDGSNVSSMGGKIWSIAFIGKIGGEQADEILKKAVTEDGAVEIASNWINQELWPEKTWDKSEVIEYIRNAAMRGLVLTRKSDNVDIVKNIYEDEFNRVSKTKKFTRLCAYAIDSMAANDFIAEHSMEDYLNLSGAEEIRSLTPYLMKYSPPPPKN